MVKLAAIDKDFILAYIHKLQTICPQNLCFQVFFQLFVTCLKWIKLCFIMIHKLSIGVNNGHNLTYLNAQPKDYWLELGLLSTLCQEITGMVLLVLIVMILRLCGLKDQILNKEGGSEDVVILIVLDL